MYGYSRQAYYKRVLGKEKRRKENFEVVEFVKEKRKRQPEVGAKKLYKEYVNVRKNKIGRDRFIEVLRGESLLIQRKRTYVKTTNSQHRLKKYGNLIKDLEIKKSGQVVVGDITYLDTEEGFCYLSLLTDYYSRKILGYCVSENLMIEGSLKALEMAMKKIPDKKGFIHHTDRGIQYCSHAYTNRLKDVGAKISMTEENHVYENALAERVNGILKKELGLGRRMLSVNDARKVVKEAVGIYNKERLHMSIGYKTPEEMYLSGSLN